VTNRNRKRLRTGRSGYDDAVAAKEVIAAREQVSCVSGEPETGTLTEKRKRPQVTLRNGAVVNARSAVVIVQQLQDTLARHPDEFKSLLALAHGRHQDADPRHFGELRACAFLENDHSIDPEVRDVLLNCYHVTSEGPVVVPLRLKDAADLPTAEKAQRASDEFLRNIIRGRIDDDDRSPD
jgi:hypothetical protein